MSGLYCINCGYERPGCACNNPDFYRNAANDIEIRKLKEQLKIQENKIQNLLIQVSELITKYQS